MTTKPPNAGIFGIGPNPQPNNNVVGGYNVVVGHSNVIQGGDHNVVFGSGPPPAYCILAHVAIKDYLDEKGVDYEFPMFEYPKDEDQVWESPLKLNQVAWKFYHEVVKPGLEDVLKRWSVSLLSVDCGRVPRSLEAQN